MKAKESIALVSLGCAKNAVDLQVRAGNLVKSGCVLSSDPDRADTVIVNTCAFIESARAEAEAEIVRALELKRRGQYRRVVVMGCYPERYPERCAAFPGVDEWTGVPKAWVEPKMPALRFTGKAFAYLKIAEGCVHRCAYCAIPAIRGSYRSRPLKSILREARALLKTGCRELNVVAQDPMLWHEGTRRLPDLLWALDRLPGDFWVRVLYSYPSEITDDFIAWLMTAKHAVRYVDVPLQHTVPEILVKMNRARAVKASLSIVDDLRSLMPDITMRTTVMTGFPGETPRRFARMMADLRRLQFDRLGAFAFSPEEGTAAAKMPGRPSHAIAEARERQVMAQQAAIWKVKARRMLGQTHRALVVAPGVARLPSQAPDVDGVIFVSDATEIGAFADIRLTGVRGFDFIGKRV